MRTIPHYALYGDQAKNSWASIFNFEWIPQRSGPYLWEIQPHVHEAFIQILYLTTGCAEVLLDDAKWKIEAPCLIVVPAHTVHGFRFSTDVDGAVITASQQFLESLAGVAMPALLQIIRKPLVIGVDQSTRHVDALMPLLLAVEREWQVHEDGQVAAGMSLIIAILVQASRISHQQQPASASGNSRKAAQIEKFRTLVEIHFRELISVDAYADKLGLSAGQLSRVCREVLGMSALDMINGRLIHEAERGLIHTSMPVKQLAGLLGFHDPAYFGRFFRKHTGTTPKQFRAKALADLALT